MKRSHHPLIRDDIRVFRLAANKRRYVQAWVDAPLSQQERTFRLQFLGQAMGLSVKVIVRWLEGEGSVGPNLADEFVWFCKHNKALGQNNPVATTDSEIAFVPFSS